MLPGNSIAFFFFLWMFDHFIHHVAGEPHKIEISRFVLCIATNKRYFLYCVCLVLLFRWFHHDGKSSHRLYKTQQMWVFGCQIAIYPLFSTFTELKSLGNRFRGLFFFNFTYHSICGRTTPILWFLYSQRCCLCSFALIKSSICIWLGWEGSITAECLTIYSRMNHTALI